MINNCLRELLAGRTNVIIFTNMFMDPFFFFAHAAVKEGRASVLFQLPKIETSKQE